jgi:hypothetical protein
MDSDHEISAAVSLALFSHEYSLLNWFQLPFKAKYGNFRFMPQFLA